MDLGNFSQFGLNPQLLMMLSNPNMANLLATPTFAWNPENLILQQALMQQLNPPPISAVPFAPLPPVPIPSQIEFEPEQKPPTPLARVGTECCPPASEDVPSTSQKPEEKKNTKPVIENPLADFEMGSLPTSTYYPTHFMKGTKLQMADGAIKKVEDVCSDDFLRCAAETSDINVNASVIADIKKNVGSVTIDFLAGPQKVRTALRVQNEHPFFVLGKGWSSCNPRKAGDTYGLVCAELEVGDICIVLTRNAEDVEPAEEKAVVDIISAERQYEASNFKDSWREDIAELYYEHMAGRVSAPPERLRTNPPPLKRRRTSESSFFE